MTSGSLSSKSAPERTSPRRLYLWLGMVTALLLLAVALFFWPRRPDPNVVRLQELGQQLFSPDSQLTPEQRQQMFREMREVGEKLTESQREQLRAQMGGMFRQRFQKEIDDYFNLPVSERKNYLDERIRRMEEMRRQFEAARGGERTANAGPGGPGAGRGPWGGDRGGDDAMSRRRRMLDETTPEQREKFTQYMQDMAARRKELGLPAMPPWGGPGGGPGRGPRQEGSPRS